MTQVTREFNHAITVSVVVPLFNKAGSVHRALSGIVRQTHTPAEVIVVDDGSTDGGSDAAAEFDLPGLQLIRQNRQGVSAARNRGIEAAGCDLVALCDADDEWHPDFLGECLRLAATFPECSVYATSYDLSSDGAPPRPAFLEGFRGATADAALLDYFHVAAHSDPPICSSSVVARKSALIAVGGFPHGATAGEDLLTWARLAARYRIAFCATPHVTVFLRPAARTPYARYAIPDEPDVITPGLNALKTVVPRSSRDDLNVVISRWHQMRAQRYLLACRRLKAVREIAAAAKLTPLAPAVGCLFFLVPLPARLRGAALTFIDGSRGRRSQWCR